MQTRSRRCSPRIARRARLARSLLLVPPSLALLNGAAAAQAPAGEFRWDELQKQGRVSVGAVLPPEPGLPFHRLKIDGRASGPTQATVLTIDRPGVKGPRYVVSGQVRYDGVEGTGYLELWNYFPGGGQYFSRTLGDQGPMMKLQGTSGWRAFALPFDATGAPPPTRLVVNVILPGRGTVYLGALMLRDLDGAGSAGLPYSHSDSDRTAGAAGATAGTVMGGLGALMGVLAAAGRARRLAVASAIALCACGVATFIAGIVTVGRSASASFPLLLVGFIGTVLPLGLLPSIRRRYEQIELRTMQAHDA